MTVVNGMKVANQKPLEQGYHSVGEHNVISRIINSKKGGIGERFKRGAQDEGTPATEWAASDKETDSLRGIQRGHTPVVDALLFTLVTDWCQVSDLKKWRMRYLVILGSCICDHP